MSSETLERCSAAPSSVFPLQDLPLPSCCTIDSLRTYFFVKNKIKKKAPMSWTGRQFGTHQTGTVDSHMHKSKQLADCDSTPSANKITMYDIVSKKRLFVQNRQLERSFWRTRWKWMQPKKRKCLPVPEMISLAFESDWHRFGIVLFTPPMQNSSNLAAGDSW